MALAGGEAVFTLAALDVGFLTVVEVLEDLLAGVAGLGAGFAPLTIPTIARVIDFTVVAAFWATPEPGFAGAAFGLVLVAGLAAGFTTDFGLAAGLAAALAFVAGLALAVAEALVTGFALAVAAALVTGFAFAAALLAGLGFAATGLATTFLLGRDLAVLAAVLAGFAGVAEALPTALAGVFTGFDFAATLALPLCELLEAQRARVIAFRPLRGKRCVFILILNEGGCAADALHAGHTTRFAPNRVLRSLPASLTPL